MGPFTRARPRPPSLDAPRASGAPRRRLSSPLSPPPLGAVPEEGSPELGEPFREEEEEEEEEEEGLVEGEDPGARAAAEDEQVGGEGAEVFFTRFRLFGYEYVHTCRQQ